MTVANANSFFFFSTKLPTLFLNSLPYSLWFKCHKSSEKTSRQCSMWLLSSVVYIYLHVRSRPNVVKEQWHNANYEPSLDFDPKKKTIFGFSSFPFIFVHKFSHIRLIHQHPTSKVIGFDPTVVFEPYFNFILD